MNAMTDKALIIDTLRAERRGLVQKIALIDEKIERALGRQKDSSIDMRLKRLQHKSRVTRPEQGD